MRVQAGGAARPLFFLCAGQGDVLGCVAFARVLGEDRPLYALQPLVVDDGVLPDEPELTARYVAAIRSVQPSGPYLIAGNSSGGLMAVQVARAFHAAGEPDGMLVLLDAPYHIRRNVLRLLLFLQRPLSRLLAGGRFGGHELLTLIRAVFDDEGLRVTLNALRHYRPRPYAGRALLFVPERRYRYFSALPWTGWRRRGNEQVTIQRVPGDHYTMHQPPHLEALAGLVRAAIAAFDD